MTRVIHRSVSCVDFVDRVSRPRVISGVGGGDGKNDVLLKGVVLPLALALALAGVLYWVSGKVA